MKLERRLTVPANEPALGAGVLEGVAACAIPRASAVDQAEASFDAARVSQRDAVEIPGEHVVEAVPVSEAQTAILAMPATVVEAMPVDRERTGEREVARAVDVGAAHHVDG